MSVLCAFAQKRLKFMATPWLPVTAIKGQCIHWQSGIQVICDHKLWTVSRRKLWITLLPSYTVLTRRGEHLYACLRTPCEHYHLPPTPFSTHAIVSSSVAFITGTDSCFSMNTWSLLWIYPVCHLIDLGNNLPLFSYFLEFWSGLEFIFNVSINLIIGCVREQGKSNRYFV